MSAVLRPSLRGAVVASLLLFGSAAPAQDAKPADPSTPISSDATEEIRRVTEELQRTQRELEALRESLEAQQRAAKQADHPSERVGFGRPVVVAAGDRVEQVVGFGDDVQVDGQVDGDATSFGGSVIVGATGVVYGDAVAFGGDVRVHEGGQIHGGQISLGTPALVHDASDAPLMGSLGDVADAEGLFSILYRRLILLLSFAGAGVMVVGLFPNRVGRIASTLEQRPFRSGLVGVLATGVLTLFSLLFAVVTVGLGLPVSLMVVGLLGLAWLMGFVGLCQAVGDRLPFEQKPHGRWLAFLVGTVLLTCVGSLPLVGWMVLVAASSIGIGAALSSRLGGR